MGGKQTFAALCINDSNAQFVYFAKSWSIPIADIHAVRCEHPVRSLCS